MSMPNILISEVMKPERILTLTSTERYLGRAEDPLKYIPADPIPGWSWDAPPVTDEGEINGFAARAAARNAYRGIRGNPEMTGTVASETCESSGALREQVKELVRVLEMVEWQLVREGFLGDISYELTHSEAGADYRIVVWARGKVAAQVFVASKVGDPQEDTLEWVKKVDTLMVPTIQNYLPLLIGLGLGVVGLAYYVTR